MVPFFNLKNFWIIGIMESYELQLVSMVNGISSWICKTSKMSGRTPSNKQQEIILIRTNLNVRLLHRKVCYLLS